MPNTLVFTIDSVTADRTQGVLKDESVLTDPVREGCAIFVKGYKMNAAGSIEATLTIESDNANPETDSEWTFNLLKDGWFRFLIVAIPDMNTSESYDLYDTVFDPFTGNVYRSKQDSNTQDTLTDTDYWEEISDPALLASNEGEDNESNNIDSLIYEPGLFSNSEYGFANQIASASEEYLTSLNIPDDDLDRYSLLAVLVDGGYVKADRSEMNQAERICRRLESILETFDN